MGNVLLPPGFTGGIASQSHIQGVSNYARHNSHPLLFMINHTSHAA
jgi:hypothetical protein